MWRSRLVTVATWALAVAAAGQVAFGVYWWLGNQVAVPGYGDTVEYIAQSSTFALDGYRTVAYPFAIRLANDLSSALHVPWTVLLYQAQLVAWFAAAWYLMRTMAPYSSRRRILACSIVLTTVPLPLHYAATVLTDSFALSSLVLVTSAAARVAARDRVDWRTLIVLILGVAVAVFVRPDRLYVVSAIAGLVVIVILLRTRKRASSPLTMHRAVVVACIVLAASLLPALATTALNRTTQTADLGRQEPSLAGSVFARIAGPHVDQIRALVPAEVADAMPPVGATRWEVRTALVEAGGNAYLAEAVKATLDCCVKSVIYESTRDVARGIGGPYQIAFDWTTESNSSANWDFTRMEQHRPGASRAVMAWSVVSALVLLLASVAAVVEARRRRDDPCLANVTAILIGACVVVATFFGLITSSVPNPRYTLISQVVAWALPMGVLFVHARSRREASPEESRDGDNDDEEAIATVSV